MLSIFKYIPNIHPEGYRFIMLFLLLYIISNLYLSSVSWVFLYLTLFCCLFFRNPNRIAPDNNTAIISAADGIITSIEEITPPVELDLGEDKLTRISTFLSVFDVHVNYIPFAGKIVAKHYHPGKFLNATLDKSSEENERQLLTIERDNIKVGLVQIAGLIARRIVCYANLNDNYNLGKSFGIIRFGSRVDVFIPKSYKTIVKVGQRMVGGETIIAIEDSQ